jgi:hypothetical protein
VSVVAAALCAPAIVSGVAGGARLLAGALLAEGNGTLTAVSDAATAVAYWSMPPAPVCLMIATALALGASVARAVPRRRIIVLWVIVGLACGAMVLALRSGIWEPPPPASGGEGIVTWNRF